MMQLPLDEPLESPKVMEAEDTEGEVATEEEAEYDTPPKVVKPDTGHSAMKQTNKPRNHQAPPFAGDAGAEEWTSVQLVDSLDYDLDGYPRPRARGMEGSHRPPRRVDYD